MSADPHQPPLCGNTDGVGGWQPGPCVLPAGHGPEHADADGARWSTDIHKQLLWETRDSQFEPGSTYSPLDFDRYRAALRAVVELHAPDENGRCRSGSCYGRHIGDGRRFRHKHPCPTVQVVARELGIEETRP